MLSEKSAELEVGGVMELGKENGMALTDKELVQLVLPVRVEQAEENPDHHHNKP